MAAQQTQRAQRQAARRSVRCATPDLRTFGQIAATNAFFCGLGSGKAIPSPNAEKTKTSKADLIAALRTPQ
jgi:hypothetical protein